MDPSTRAAEAQAARDEELRRECAKAFDLYKKGNVTRGSDLLLKLLARHPRHPLLHYAHGRLAHKRAMEQRQLEDLMKHFDECCDRAEAGIKACPHSLIIRLLYTQVCYDFPAPNDEVLDGLLKTFRSSPTAFAAKPLNTADLEYAKAITTFDEDALLFFPDVRECADSAAYRSQALTNLAKAPDLVMKLYGKIKSLARTSPGQCAWDGFIGLRDAEHTAEADRRLQRVQARAREEEADRALAAAHRVMAGEGTAHDLQEAAAGWRDSADQGDASAQLLIGALYGRGGGGVKKNLPLGKRYLELSAAAGYEAAVALLKELRKCVACGELDVHHMICSRCRNVRYCDKGCQLQHWQDSHTLHCVQQRESVGAGGSSDRVEPPAHQDFLTDQIAAAVAARETGNDLFRKQKYPEVWPGINRSELW